MKPVEAALGSRDNSLAQRFLLTNIDYHYLSLPHA